MAVRARQLVGIVTSINSNALDETLDLRSGTKSQIIERAMQGWPMQSSSARIKKVTGSNESA
jgi:hypothetical protein